MKQAKYYIYRNLRNRCFSIKHKGKVIDHAMSFIVEDAILKVNEKGRLRVCKEKQKNVHAFVVGRAVQHTDSEDFYLLKKLSKFYDFDNRQFIEISYNPYKTNSFYVVDTGEPIIEAKEVRGQRGKIYAYGIKYQVGEIYLPGEPQ